VPTLDHDGAIVTDSTVITEYLDEVVPQNGFTPEDPVLRARMRALMHFIDESRPWRFGCRHSISRFCRAFRR